MRCVYVAAVCDWAKHVAGIARGPVTSARASASPLSDYVGLEHMFSAAGAHGMALSLEQVDLSVDG